VVAILPSPLRPNFTIGEKEKHGGRGEEGKRGEDLLTPLMLILISIAPERRKKLGRREKRKSSHTSLTSVL